MTTQPIALRLSLRLEQLANLEANELAEVMGDAATELRRLHAVNQELLEALQRCEAVMRLELSRGEAYEAARAAIAKAEGLNKATGETK